MGDRLASIGVQHVLFYTTTSALSVRRSARADTEMESVSDRPEGWTGASARSSRGTASRRRGRRGAQEVWAYCWARPAAAPFLSTASRVVDHLCSMIKRGGATESEWERGKKYKGPFWNSFICGATRTCRHLSSCARWSFDKLGGGKKKKKDEKQTDMHKLRRYRDKSLPLASISVSRTFHRSVRAILSWCCRTVARVTFSLQPDGVKCMLETSFSDSTCRILDMQASADLSQHFHILPEVFLLFLPQHDFG